MSKMILVKDEMPKIEEVCEILLKNGEEVLAMRVKASESEVVWYNDLHDVEYADSEVEAWKYFFEN